MRCWPGAPAFESGVTLETERLRLRLFEERDVEAFAAMYADAETMRYIGEGKVLTRSETWRSTAMLIGHWMLRGYGMWAAELKETGEVIGRIGCHNPEGWPGFELGWLLGRPYWGKGYACEAAKACRDYAFGTLKRERILSLIRPDNQRSIRVAEKLGERLTQEIDLLGGKSLVYAIER